MISSNSQRGHGRRERNFSGIFGSYSGTPAQDETKAPAAEAKPQSAPEQAKAAGKPDTRAYRQLDLF